VSYLNEFRELKCLAAPVCVARDSVMSGRSLADTNLSANLFEFDNAIRGLPLGPS
jgi:hypothetical protein